MEDYRVICVRHGYDTLYSLSRGTAVSAAAMHALLPCTTVTVTRKGGELVNWQAEVPQNLTPAPPWQQKFKTDNEAIGVQEQDADKPE